MQSSPEFRDPPPGCPAHAGGRSVPLYGPEFAAAPSAFYTSYASTGPPLRSSSRPAWRPHWSPTTPRRSKSCRTRIPSRGTRAAGARSTRGEVPPDSPVLPMLAYRPNTMFSDGAEHLRLRQAVTDSLARVDMHRMGRQSTR